MNDEIVTFEIPAGRPAAKWRDEVFECDCSVCHELTTECLHDDRVLREVLHYECPDCGACMGPILPEISNGRTIAP